MPSLPMISSVHSSTLRPSISRPHRIPASQVVLVHQLPLPILPLDSNTLQPAMAFTVMVPTSEPLPPSPSLSQRMAAMAEGEATRTT